MTKLEVFRDEELYIVERGGRYCYKLIDKPTCEGSGSGVMKLLDEDDDNSQAFAQQWVCLLCKERFTLGEMLPGKTWLSSMRCPYCKSEETAREGNFN